MPATASGGRSVRLGAQLMRLSARSAWTRRFSAAVNATGAGVALGDGFADGAGDVTAGVELGVGVPGDGFRRDGFVRFRTAPAYLPIFSGSSDLGVRSRTVDRERRSLRLAFDSGRFDGGRIDALQPRRHGGGRSQPDDAQVRQCGIGEPRLVLAATAAMGREDPPDQRVPTELMPPGLAVVRPPQPLPGSRPPECPRDDPTKTGP